jgi:putative DNA primase/helicase
VSDRVVKIRPRVEKQKPPPAVGWRALLLTRESKHGVVTKAIAANAVTILRHDDRWSDVIGYNEFLDAVETRRAPPWDAVDAPAALRAGEWSEADTARAQNWLSRNYEIDLGAVAVEAAVIVAAEQNKFHPVRDWLGALTWDQTPRVAKLFAVYFGAEDTDYHRGVSTRFMISAVARVYRPGSKVDTVPILEGAQGIGKSTAIRALASDPWFSDTPMDLGSKDAYQSLRGKWIPELGELSALSRSDAERAKNFLSATFDTYRPSFGRRTRDFPRQCVFVGSTNQSEYLRDVTGNRRFWPVLCGAIDVAGIRRDRDQLWAEAVVRFNAGEAWHVDSSDFAQLAEDEQDDRFVEDPWREPIESWASNPLRAGNGITVNEVLADALKIQRADWSKGLQDRVSAVLKRIGWERGKQTREGAERVRRWHQLEKNSKPVTSPVTSPVTRENGSQISLSPVSPVDLHTHKRASDPDLSIRVMEPAVTAVTPVTGDTRGVP